MDLSQNINVFILADIRESAMRLPSIYENHPSDFRRLSLTPSPGPSPLPSPTSSQISLDRSNHSLGKDIEHLVKTKELTQPQKDAYEGYVDTWRSSRDSMKQSRGPERKGKLNSIKTSYEKLLQTLRGEG